MRIDANLNGFTEMVGSKLERPMKAAANSIQGELRDKAELSKGEAAGPVLTTQSLSGDDIRSARVDALRAAIINGTYAPNPHAIAEAMFNELF
jgi:flagellar biosynthesis anti-sigma factor FlgM